MTRISDFDAGGSEGRGDSEWGTRGNDGFAVAAAAVAATDNQVGVSVGRGE